MCLIPVDDKLLHLSIADDVFAYVVVFAVDVLDVGVLLGVEGPASSGEAVLGRVHRLAGALGGKVSDEETDRQVPAELAEG